MSNDLIVVFSHALAGWLTGPHAELALPMLGYACLALALGVIGASLTAGLVQRQAVSQGAAAQAQETAKAMADAKDEVAERLVSELAELKGRLATIADMGGVRQAELSSTLETRLGAVSSELAQQLRETRSDLDRHLDETRRTMAQSLTETSTRLNDSLVTSAARTGDHLAQLAERLATIDVAQARISELSSRVVSLQDVLSNKQARGAFGQVRMESIIQDGLPRGTYTFQATLSNGRRPDCIIRLPNSPAGLAVDAKFPLEGFEAHRLAQTDDARTAAARAVRDAIGKHIDDIAGKYLIAGETQDTALMFVPSESIYAELHETFPDLIQRAHRARVVIVSPNMLMLAIQTMQAILKDVQMREAAGRIQREVGAMLEDLTRLDSRIADLERHFALAGKSLDQLGTSAEKITKRGQRIAVLDLGDPEGAQVRGGSVSRSGEAASEGTAQVDPSLSDDVTAMEADTDAEAAALKRA